MSIETEEELAGMKAAGAVVAEALAAMREQVAPGVSTAELDAVAEEVLGRHGAESAPRAVYQFPGAACISVNDEAVHGIPGPRLLEAGDLVTLDVTLSLNGFFADAAVTVGVDRVSAEAEQLIACTEAAFWVGAHAARDGVMVADVGGRVEAEVRRRGFQVVRELCGHGIGRTIHEEPQMCNFYDRTERARLRKGMVIALEPIVSQGSRRIRTARDGWTIVSADGSLTAHYEHTLMITESIPMILTSA